MHLKKILLVPLALVILSTGLAARDINLDEIYLEPSSGHVKRLVWQKLDAYQRAGAQLIERDVAFAGWMGAGALVYIREFSASDENGIFSFDIERRRSAEIRRIRGTITAARVTTNGRYLVLKRIIARPGSIIPRNEIVVVSLSTGEITSLPSLSVSQDFSLSRDGASMLYEDEKGIEELFFFSGTKRLLLSRGQYADIAEGNLPSCAYLSPDRSRCVVVSGGGGNYRAKVIQGSRAQHLGGVTSPSEIYWLSNTALAFRSGSSGNFAVTIYDVQQDRRTVLPQRSLNTGLNLSEGPGVISYSRDQMIYLYFPSQRQPVATGIEGGDVTFDPSGGRFLAIVCKRLFVVNYALLTQRRIELKRSWREIAALYREAKNNPSLLSNEYSSAYVERKIEIYDELLRK